MFGDFYLFVKLGWKRFWCIHEYKIDRFRFSAGKGFGFICDKCHKYSEK